MFGDFLDPADTMYHLNGREMSRLSFSVKHVTLKMVWRFFR
jgi:hypothetical protein